MTVVDAYNLALEIRASLYVADGRYRIHVAGTTIREGVLRREPMFSGV